MWGIELFSEMTKNIQVALYASLQWKKSEGYKVLLSIPLNMWQLI